MKFSRLEKATLCLTALALAFLGGWFASRQYEINRQFIPVAAELPSRRSPLPQNHRQDSVSILTQLLPKN